jgi:hypothetical protein
MRGRASSAARIVDSTGLAWNNKAKYVPDEKIPDFLIEVVGNHQS